MSTRKCSLPKRNKKHKNLERLDYLNGFTPISAIKLREAFEQSKSNNEKSKGGQDE